MRYECLTCAFSCHSWREMTLHGDSFGHGDCYDYDLEFTRSIVSWDTFRLDGAALLPFNPVVPFATL